ncbi:Nucleoside diphosphate-linked moiety X motif 19, partial [Frankliniella fusca]
MTMKQDKEKNTSDGSIHLMEGGEEEVKGEGESRIDDSNTTLGRISVYTPPESHINTYHQNTKRPKIEIENPQHM